MSIALLLVAVALAGPDVVDLAAGVGHSCLLRADGAVACWGGLEPRALVRGEAPEHLVPHPIAVDGVTQLSAGGRNRTCAVRGEGEVWCWTLNEAPARLDGIRARQVSVGEAHACAVAVDGSAWCWGHNGRGQLGDGTTTDRDAPVRVAGLDDVVAVTAGFHHACALRRDGTVRCWGHNGRGQLGNARTSDAEPLPVAVAHLHDAVEVDAGCFHTCARRRSGHVVCWGSNQAGQLGDGSRTDGTAAAAVRGLDDAIDLAVGRDHACAVRRGGAVACWGDNSQGQAGAPGTRPLVFAATIGGLDDARSLVAGHQHTCAIRRSGELACWGQNWTGQLGDGSRERRATPVRVKQP